MDTKDILRSKAGRHIGYELKSISLSLLSHADIIDMGYKKLQRISNKISAYLHRDKIKSAYKSKCMKRPYDEYYLIYAIDGTLFHLEY